MENNICVGSFITGESKWCVRNGCIKADDIYYLKNTRRAKCDCPLQEQHPHIQQYICYKCPHLPQICNDNTIIIEGCSLCEKCDASFVTLKDGQQKYCSICSAIHRVCIYCGNKEL